MAITITVKGADQVQRKLQNLQRGVRDLTPAFRDMQDSIILEFLANFPAKGEVLNSPWPPRKRAYPWPILDKTGKMKGNWKAKPSARELRIENPTDYATYHNFGTAYLPVRKLVGSNQNIIKLAMTRIQIFLKKYL